MPFICQVTGCLNKSNETNSVSFFSFPRSDVYIQLWLKVCRNKNINVKYAKICSIHFSPESYKPLSYVNEILNTIPITTRRLRDDAVPTEHLFYEKEIAIENQEQKLLEIPSGYENNDILENLSEELEIKPADYQNNDLQFWKNRALTLENELRNISQKYFLDIIKQQKNVAFWERNCRLYKIRAKYAENRLKLISEENLETLDKLKEEPYPFDLL